MKVIYVRIIDWRCDACRDALLEDCRAAHLELPTGAFAIIPDHWRDRICPHDAGFTMDILGPARLQDHDSDDDDADSDEARIESIERDDQPILKKNRWRDLFPDSIDATKGIGYPAREVGRYGSYPQHDGSEDE